MDNYYVSTPTPFIGLFSCTHRQYDLGFITTGSTTSAKSDGCPDVSVESFCGGGDSGVWFAMVSQRAATT